MTVDATDADDPDTDNAALRYSILEQGAAGMFSINATTGEICTARPGLDREVAGWGHLYGIEGVPGFGTPHMVKPCPRAEPGVGTGWLGSSWGVSALPGAGRAQLCPLIPHRPWGCTT